LQWRDPSLEKTGRLAICPGSPATMNYLAHLYLSARNEDAWLGSLLGDFVKGPLDGRYSQHITNAIALHRKIDSFTDAHPVVLRSKSRISAARRRYAGIMIDMFYDHFLASNWTEFHDEPIKVFTARIYEILRKRSAILPDQLNYMAPRMTKSDWLASYARIDSIHDALDRMAHRLKRENRLLNSADELRDHYAALESDFRIFLPQVVQFARRHYGSEIINSDSLPRPDPGTADGGV
jgi:acyl carrier protein phosphodiesterase